MPAGWIRKAYTSDGVTEYPVGPNFDRLRAMFGGAVVLALDVSGSMMGCSLEQAVQGCIRFVDDAITGGYQVGVVLWHHGVADAVAPSADPAKARQLLRCAVANGGNDAVPFLTLAHEHLMAVNAGDRVVAIFGDGDLGDRHRAEEKAAELKKDGIRILTCGLGEGSAHELAAISSEVAVPRAATSSNLADTIASMASGLARTNTRLR